MVFESIVASILLPVFFAASKFIIAVSPAKVPSTLMPAFFITKLILDEMALYSVFWAFKFNDSQLLLGNNRT